MVSTFYNAIAYQKHTSSYPPSNHAWYNHPNYPAPGQHHLFNEADAHHQHAISQFYNHAMFPGDYHAPENMQSSPNSHHYHMFQHQTSIPSGQTQLNESTSSNGETNNHPTTNLSEALPSPPITVSGSELSSPGGVPVAASSPNGIVPGTTSSANGRVSPSIKGTYYDWMKKPSYPAQPTPGKTRTKDKYRVVYSDYQRLELEKEYCTSRYITIRRKSELANSLQLSERQVKIWFQNRRAKERKQQKKRDEPVTIMSGADYLDAKPKMEPGHLLQHMVHMGMPSMGIHHSVIHPHHPALLQQSQHLHPMHTHPQLSGSGPTPPM